MLFCVMVDCGKPDWLRGNVLYGGCRSGELIDTQVIRLETYLLCLRMFRLSSRMGKWALRYVARSRNCVFGEERAFRRPYHRG